MLKRHGHATRLVYYTGPQKQEIVLQVIEEWHPDFIGISSVSSGFVHAKQVSMVIKGVFPRSFIICGGIHPTVVPECLEETLTFDAICRGEGEYPLLQLLEAFQEGKDYTSTPSFWFRKGDTVIKNPLLSVVEDLDKLPIPDREIFDSQFVVVDFHGRCSEFLFCRGCPFDCTYCSNSVLRNIFPGKYVRYPSVQKAINELSQVKMRYCLDSVVIHDDNVTLNKQWFFSFFKEYTTRVALPFTCNARVGTFDREMLKVLKEAGCYRLNISIESGNEYIRNMILNRNMTNEQIIEVFQWIHDEGIEITSQNMVGLPEETPSRFVDTIRLNATAKVDIPHLWVFHPYPGTKLYQLCKQQELFDKSLSKNFKERSHPILQLPNFRRKDILRYYKHFNFLVERERKTMGRRFCIEKLLPPYPILFPLIFWREEISCLWRIAFSQIMQMLRKFRIESLRLLKLLCGDNIYNTLRCTYHTLKSCIMNARG
jgi:radical SAM superfamily enzyme YgiQ (UPF0313 family)